MAIKNIIQDLCEMDFTAYLEKEGHIFKGKMTLCPFHDDHRESMSVDFKNDAWLWYCHKCKMGGKSIICVMKKRCLSGDEAISRIAGNYGFDVPREEQRIVAEYSYLDEDRKELYQVVRFDPKNFRCRRSSRSYWSRFWCQCNRLFLFYIT